MKKVIENLAKLFGSTAEEVLSKLNLNENCTSKDIAKVLGVYSLFESKDEHAEYIENKLSNKEKELAEKQKQIDEQLNKINELETIANENNSKIKNELMNNVVKKEWEKLGIKRNFEKENIAFENLDFSNLTKSLINYAINEGLSFKEPKYDDFVANKDQAENEPVIAVGGAVKK